MALAKLDISLLLIGDSSKKCKRKFMEIDGILVASYKFIDQTYGIINNANCKIQVVTGFIKYLFVRRLRKEE